MIVYSYIIPYARLCQEFYKKIPALFVFSHRIWYSDSMEMMIADRVCDLYPNEEKTAPLVIVPVFKRVGEEICRLIREKTDEAFTLLTIGCPRWNHDLTPWKQDAIFKNDGCYDGEADVFLREITSLILPKIKKKTGISPEKTILCGHSLAGLFALYAGFVCDAFDGIVSVSGSLWYPGFSEFAREKTLSQSVRYVYLALGQRESLTKHPLLRTVEKKTREISTSLCDKGIPATLEIHDGGHFDDPNDRIAQGIARSLTKVF